MKTTVKRTLALLLATASMASVLTACGSSGSAAAAGSVCILRYLGTWPGTVPYQGVRRDGHRDRVRLYAV